MRSADRGRAEVYAAEVAAFEGTELEAVVPFGVLVELAGRVVAQEWWPRGDVFVRRARSDARDSTTRQASRVAIHLAAPQMTPATLIHELAHVLAGVESGHDELFRVAHVDLATSVLGADCAGWLTVAYRDAGLAVGVRQWPQPVLAVRSIAVGPAAE